MKFSSLTFFLLIILTFSACTSKKNDANGQGISETTADSESVEGGEPIADADFSRIDISGAAKVVVFIKDTCRVEIDDKTATLNDPRCSVKNGILHIAPVDSLHENRMHSIRIYTPHLVSYMVHDCGEANLSGNDVTGSIFTLDVRDVNVFRGNACIHTTQAEVHLEKMLMAKLQFLTDALNLTAKRYQHIELVGNAKQRHIDADAPHQIDSSQLK